MQPLVSIITPCYNAEKYIARLMDSVLEQTYDNIEFILVNDGSDDDSELIVKKYEKKFAERGYSFKYYYQENAGLGAAINAGLKFFTGEYLCWLDADDYLEKESVSERVRAFEEHPDCAVVTSNAYVRDCEHLDTYKYLIADRLKRSSEKEQFELLLNGDSIFCSGCHMLKVDVFLKVNPRREIYPARRGQNWQLLLPVYFEYKRYFLDKPLYNYIIYPESMSKDADTVESKLGRYAEHEQILRETLKMIEEIQGADMHQYYSFLEDKYAKLRMETAIQYGSKELFHKEWVKKQQFVGLDKRDKVMYLRNRYQIINRGMRLLGRVGRPEDVIKKLQLNDRKSNGLHPVVTIIVPCYNGSTYLNTCLECVLTQSYQKVEIIIVNDGSKDDSEEIILSYQEAFAKRGYVFRYISQDNQGAAAAINNALPYVTGDYLMLYDVDDVLFRDNVRSKVEFLEQHSEYSMVCNNGYYVKSPSDIGIHLFWSKKSYGIKKDIFTELLTEKISNWPGSYMVRTKDFMERILPNRQIYISQFGQNLQVMLPMAYRSKVGFIKKPLMKYYVRSDSHSHVGDRAEIIERAKGYEGNRLGVLKSMHMTTEEVEKYMMLVREHALKSRIQQAIKWRDEKYFYEGLQECTKWRKALYKFQWMIAKVGIYSVAVQSWTFLTKVTRVWRNIRWNLKFMNENEQGY